MSERHTVGHRRARARRRAGEAGQTTTEYVMIVATVASLSLGGFNLIGGSMRDAVRHAVMRVLSVVTGTP